MLLLDLCSFLVAGLFAQNLCDLCLFVRIADAICCFTIGADFSGGVIRTKFVQFVHFCSDPDLCNFKCDRYSPKM